MPIPRAHLLPSTKTFTPLQHHPSSTITSNTFRVMPPTLILLRHAEALHNSTQNFDLVDPPLTDGGVQQCADLQRHLRTSCPLAMHIEAIISSPMRRTLQTATLSFAWLLKAGVPLEIDALWQENSTAACDTGCGLNVIKKEWPQLDFSDVPETYIDKEEGSPYAYTRQANNARGETCLKKLYERKEKVIAVVSHAGFLRTGISRRRYANADYRIFTFGKAGDGKFDLFEDPDTSRKGGGMGRSEKGIFSIRDWDFPPGEEEEEEEEEEEGEWDGQ